MAKDLSIRLKIDADTGKIKSVSDGFVKLDARVSSAKKGVSSFNDRMMNIAKGVAGVYLVKQAFDVTTDAVKSFVNTAAQFEQFETTLKTIEGSSQAAEKSMGWIRNFASSTPYELAQVTDSFVKLKAYGIEPTDGTLRTLGDTAAAMGKDINQAVEAMADAVTGENERLKEFGIKAKVEGDKITYAWSDASGNAKHIVVQNNREIIQSTLSAIMNSKYAGAMEEQAKTWNGMVSNMKDQWTIFKSDVMDAGLFDYLKAIVGVVGDYLSAAFGDAKKGAASFSESVIAGIESSIEAFGLMYDIMNGIDLVWETMKNGGIEFFLAVSEAITFWEKDWNVFTVDMQNAWVMTTHGMKKLWYDLINFLGKEWTDFWADWVVGVNKIAEYMDIDFRLEVPTFSPTIVDEFKKIEYAQNSVSDSTKYWQSVLKDSDKELKKLYESVKNEDGTKAAQKAIDDIKSKLKEITSATKSDNSEKEKSIAYLEKMGMLEGAIGKAVKKTSDAQKKAAKDAEKSAKKAADAARKESERFTDDFASAFEGVLGGDVSSAFRSFFNNISTEMVDPWINDLSKSLSSGLSSLLGGLGTGGTALLGVGVGAIGSLIGGLFSDTLSQAEIDAAKGRVDFSDESLTKLADIVENVENPLLPYTKRSSEYLSGIDRNMYYLAQGLSNSAGISVTGADFVPTTDYKLGGIWGETSRELIGSGLNLGDIDFNGGVSASIWQTIKETDSSFFGLVEEESIRRINRDASDELNNYINDILLSGKDLIVDASAQLGYDAANAMRDMIVTTGDISLEGLSDAEVSDRLNNYFSEIFSSTIDSLGPINDLVDRYQKSGEESLETLGRIATEYEQAVYTFKSIDKYFSSFGAYTAQMQVLDVVDYSGGLTAFSDNFNAFVNNFYTDAEQLDMMNKSLEDSFNALGISMPDTNDEFRNLIETFQITDEASAETYASLLSLSDAFYDVKESSEEAARASRDAAAQAADEARSKYVDLWLGEYSPLSMVEKSMFASGVAASDPTYDNLGTALEQSYRRATTEEDYRLDFIKLSQSIEKTENESISDVIEELRNVQSSTRDELSESRRQTELLKQLIRETRTQSRIS